MDFQGMDDVGSMGVAHRPRCVCLVATSISFLVVGQNSFRPNGRQERVVPRVTLRAKKK
jgi:hypothetical protein